MDPKHVEQALMNAGFVPSSNRPGVVYGGFRVTSEDNGDAKVVHVSGEYTGMRVDTAHRRKLVGSAVSRMERELSRQGWQVVLFEPDAGCDFWLRVLSEDASYRLPGETEAAYLERVETESDRAAWSAQDR